MHETRTFLLVWGAFMLGVFVDRFAFHELIQEETEPTPETLDVWFSANRPYDWEGRDHG